MQRNNAKQIALGGVFAAIAIVIMCLGGLIPVATYVCPMLCTMICFVVLSFCGRRIAWAWYSVVVLLGLLFGPDKEAVMVFLALGYYPLIKQRIEARKLKLPVKLLYFNVSTVVAYGIMIYLMGMTQIARENIQWGIAGLLLILALGNVTFLLLDRVLMIMGRKLQ